MITRNNHHSSSRTMGLPAKICVVMTVISLATFGTLTVIYELFFNASLFA